MPDETMQDLRVADRWGMKPWEVQTMPNYLYLHILEYMEIQNEVDHLAKLEAKREARQAGTCP